MKWFLFLLFADIHTITIKCRMGRLKSLWCACNRIDRCSVAHNTIWIFHRALAASMHRRMSFPTIGRFQRTIAYFFSTSSFVTTFGCIHCGEKTIWKNQMITFDEKLFHSRMRVTKNRSLPSQEIRTSKVVVSSQTRILIANKAIDVFARPHRFTIATHRRPITTESWTQLNNANEFVELSWQIGKQFFISRRNGLDQRTHAPTLRQGRVSLHVG